MNFILNMILIGFRKNGFFLTNQKEFLSGNGSHQTYFSDGKQKVKYKNLLSSSNTNI